MFRFLANLKFKLPMTLSDYMRVSKKISILLIFGLNFCMVTYVYSEQHYNKTPVFFVHGHGANAKSWKPMMSYLIKSGYPERYLRAIQLKPNKGPNINVAEKQIAPAIEDFIKEINAFIKKKYSGIPLKTKVDLISHSMGALSTRWYAAKVRPNRVRTWISLCGANHGTNQLCWGSDPGTDDLCPAYARNGKESLIQFLLNGKPHVADIDETPYGIGVDSPGVDSILPDPARNILYLTIRISHDKWIKPEDSAILDGAGGVAIIISETFQARETSPGNILLTNRLGHDKMLGSPYTLFLVKTILDQIKRKPNEVMRLR